MRDVTDNKTGELEVGEVKRGRGRPRKADAMTNAQRQAAYRARHRAPNTVTVGGVTRKADVGDGALLAFANAELDRVRADLAWSDSHRQELLNANEKAFSTIRSLRAQLKAAKDAEIAARAEVVELELRLRGQKKTVTAKRVTKKGAKA